MTSTTLRFSIVCLFVGGLAGGCSTTDECFDDRNCGSGRRCERESGKIGACVACEVAETPYDGIDNDCDPTTRDFDLDADGENAITAPTRRGKDCDDNDPDVNSKALELCSDQKDNDCDGTTDEAGCGDQVPPTVRIVDPRAGVLFETLSVRVDVSDDTRVTEVELRTNDVLYGTSTQISGGRVEFSLDTYGLSDGALTLCAVAKDTAERTSRDCAMLLVDNKTPPHVTVDAPTLGAAHRGRMPIEVEASDAAGIATLDFSIDAIVVGSSSSAIFRGTFDVDVYADNTEHTFAAIATDVTGNETSVEVPFRVDRTGPTIAFDLVAGQRVSGDLSVVIRAADRAGVASIRSRAGTSDNVATSTTVLRYLFDTRTVHNGPTTLTATATDDVLVDGVKLGNESASSITIDVYNVERVPPSVAFVTPRADDGVYRSTRIIVDATSPTAIEAVEFFVDGQSLGAPITAAPYEAFFDFSYSTGTIEISATALDVHDNTTTASIAVSVVLPPVFRLALEYPLSSGSGDGLYAVGDVTGDAVPDVVVVGSNTSLLVGTSTSFRYLPVAEIDSAGGSDLALVDMDGDADLDVVTLGSSDVHILVNDGVGNFAPPLALAVPFDLPAEVFAIADIDGNGRLDIVLGHSGSVVADFAMILQDRSGAFAAAPQAPGLSGEVTDIVAADLDGDGAADVIVSRENTDFVTVFRNGGDGTFGAGRDIFVNSPVVDLMAIEMTGDNFIDLVATHVDPEPTISVLAGDGDTGLTPASEWKLQDEPDGLAIADFDGDGDLDLVTTRSNGAEVYETTDNPFDSRHSYAMTTRARQPRIVDLDGDGQPEIVTLGEANDVLAIAPNRGAAAGEWRFGAAPLIPIDFIVNRSTCPYGPPPPSDRAPGSVAIGEVSGGGAPDIVFGVDAFACNPAPNSVPPITPPPIPPALVILANGGDGNFEARPQIDLDAAMSPTNITIGDIDGAFGLDMAIGSDAVPEGADPLTPTAALVASTAGSGFAVTNVSLHRPTSGAIGDVDGDGTGDVVFSVRPDDAPSGAALVNAAGGIRDRFSGGQGASSVVIDNLDSDPNGTLDFAVANSESNNITLFTWNGASFDADVINTNASISSLATARLAGDNRLDLLGVGESGVVVLEGDPRFTFASPTGWFAGEPSTPFRIASGDFNRDGLTDVIVLNASTDRFALLIARPQGGFFPPDYLSLSRDPSDFAVGPIWSGETDIVLVNQESPSVLFVLNETPLR